jgi:Tol biopolymer transport system component
LAAEGSTANGPAYSPDGELIAFKRDRAGGTVAGWQWWVIGADGSHPRQVTTEGNAVATPAWGFR